MKKLLFLGILFLVFVSCSQEASKTMKQNQELRPENGDWKVSFISQKHDIPTRMSIENNQLTFFNAEESVELFIEYAADSFYVDIPNFDSHLEGIVQSDKQMKGVFIKDYASDYAIPFIAFRTDSSVFEISDPKGLRLKDKYAVNIINGSRVTSAIGLFKQKANNVTAGIATETGDYRYLQGVIDGNKLKLSRFDGSSLQLFTADIKGDSLINGVFISGKGGNYTWNAVYSNAVILRDPEALTSIKDGNSEIDFTLVNLNNEPISLTDQKFKDKVKIIQITGTWCPNCLDETRYFNKLYSMYKDKGFEIIAVAFENGNDTLAVLEKLKRYKKNNAIEYTLLYGGKNSSKNAEIVFPILDKVMSFPTAIYLDRNNNIEKIYTGFYGPGTGQYYVDYTRETENYISTLLSKTN